MEFKQAVDKIYVDKLFLLGENKKFKHAFLLKATSLGSPIPINLMILSAYKWWTVQCDQLF